LSEIELSPQFSPEINVPFFHSLYDIASGGTGSGSSGGGISNNNNFACPKLDGHFADPDDCSR